MVCRVDSRCSSYCIRSAVRGDREVTAAGLTEFAQRQGEAGPMTHLACFFKDPLGVSEQSFVEQVRLLTDYVARHAKNGRAARRKPRRAR